jgi:DNA-3-methyladenine glycosylase I
MNRCPWCENNDLYIKYHDDEWGVPVHDDMKHFEFLTLEIFQSGLSWLTILKKRENFRKAFSNFDYSKISKYNEEKIEELMNDKGIIRNRKKIEATINNANKFIKIREEFKSFENYIWNFVDGAPIINKWEKIEELPTKSELSDIICKDLKKRGFKFIGSIVIYSHLQATGLINDHLTTCFKYKEIKKI